METGPGVLLAGGGTGGHLFPGLAVAAELARRQPSLRLAVAGTDRPLERRVLTALGHRRFVLPLAVPGDLRRRPLPVLLETIRSFAAARQAIRRFRPDVIVGLGGLASVPVVVAGRLAGVPAVLLEQNVIPGRATRWLSRLARRVCVSFDRTIGLLHGRSDIRTTGNPVRREIAELGAAVTEPDDRPVLLVLGGSQGASSLNRDVPAAAAAVADRLAGWEVIHQCGDGAASEVRKAYAQAGVTARVEPFFERPHEWYRRSRLVIARAGATTLAELACAGCPAVLVPYRFATDDHQRVNAEWYQAAGAARVVPESRTVGALPFGLGQELSELLVDEVPRVGMAEAMKRTARADAAERVADVIAELCPALGPTSDRPLEQPSRLRAG